MTSIQLKYSIDSWMIFQAERNRDAINLANSSTSNQSSQFNKFTLKV